MSLQLDKKHKIIEVTTYEHGHLMCIRPGFDMFCSKLSAPTIKGKLAVPARSQAMVES